MHDGPGANDVAERLAHFGAVHEQPAVGPDLFRYRKAGGHQEGGPVNGVEADDFLADEMEIGGPEFCFLILRAAARNEGCGWRVEPEAKEGLVLDGDTYATVTQR